MSSDNTTPQPPQTPRTWQQWLVVLALVAAAIWFALHNPKTARSIALVGLGFGGVVMIHELGHFIVAKLGGIRVEAFSIGFPPVLIGIRKRKKGFKIRLLPRSLTDDAIQEGDSPTEYQIGLIPLGGFVKMLGQSDTGAAAATDDPHSFANRPIWIRIAVVAAGVVFNALGAMILFTAIFLYGIDLKPAVVGEVVPNSPAYDAGIKPGDRIVQIDGQRFVDFEAVLLAPALSAKGKPIEMVVRGAQGERTVKLIAERASGDPTGLRALGIVEAHTLTIDPKLAENPTLAQEIFQQSGLKPNDQVRAVNDQPITAPWELYDKLNQSLSPEVKLTLSRSSDDGQTRTQATVRLPLRYAPVVRNFRNENDVAHFFGLTPLLKVSSVLERPQAMKLWQQTQRSVLKRLGRPMPPSQFDSKPALQEGDVIIRVGNVAFPTYAQLRQVTTEHKDKPLEMVVWRKDQAGQLTATTVIVWPYEVPDSNRVTIGISVDLAMELPYVAATIEKAGVTLLAPLPAGARIIAVDGQPTETFYDIVRRIHDTRGQRISIDYISDGQAGGAGLIVPSQGGIYAEAFFGTAVPFAALMQVYKADNAWQAAAMGYRKAQQFIVRTVITIWRLIQRQVPSSSLVGPVGIIRVSYTLADSSLIHYLYFLGLIGACLAVMNLLPLPVLDGGVIVMLLIEKLAGKPIPEKIQSTISYVGLALLLSLMLWVTYRDVLRILF